MEWIRSDCIRRHRGRFSHVLYRLRTINHDPDLGHTFDSDPSPAFDLDFGLDLDFDSFFNSMPPSYTENWLTADYFFCYETISLALLILILALLPILILDRC
ncbi:hypothetical protein EVAR_30818_1 [Eumeta japonica]|uniref:Uncharacterized protein n=1 Tax=Eumeta variegata TaxID=151549 RepID=A0A4C2ACB8_EUMVA|nr:hypothetical protein EVAR_30818_1 [Eumeta japonica]